MLRRTVIYCQGVNNDICTTDRDGASWSVLNNNIRKGAAMIYAQERSWFGLSAATTKAILEKKLC